jgi:hypothetical protein
LICGDHLVDRERAIKASDREASDLFPVYYGHLASKAAAFIFYFSSPYVIA